MKKSTTIIAVLAAGLFALPALAGGMKGEVKDAWITGRIETMYMLNRHLNNFTIDTDVQDGVVHLTGSVVNSIDRDLAGELARGIDGVTSVDNDLKIDVKAGAATTRTGRTFTAWVDDATTTAEVKSKLLANGNTHGLQIDVDTESGVVTLSGKVKSDEEKQLAGQIARNAGDVRDVHNKLMVE